MCVCIIIFFGGGGGGGGWGVGVYVTFNTVQVISRRVVGRAEETSTYSSLGFCTVNCRPTESNYQLSHLRPCRESNPGLRGGRRECYHSATVGPPVCVCVIMCTNFMDDNSASYILWTVNCIYTNCNL